MESIEKRLVDSFDNEISRSTIESFKELHDIWDACGNSFVIFGKLNDLLDLIDLIMMRPDPLLSIVLHPNMMVH